MQLPCEEADWVHANLSSALLTAVQRLASTVYRLESNQTWTKVDIVDIVIDAVFSTKSKTNWFTRTQA